MVDTLRSADDVRLWLHRHVYHPQEDDERHGRVGLEAELFPFWVAPDGRPAARLALVEIVAIIDGIPGAVRNPDAGDGRPSWQLQGALITEEPGAQIEVAGPPEPDAGQAIAGLERIIDGVSAAFDAHGAALAAAGLDCWSAPGEVPVQLQIARYAAMSAYFRRRGTDGPLLMCASCSLQVNVDLGPPAVARQRWLLANLAAPLLVAAFAASPTSGAVNGRAIGWQGLDPTRTGISPALVAGSDDPVEHTLTEALRADVLLVERGGAAEAGVPGWTFGEWVARGHPRYGHPDGRDLRTHLTTLFPEARLRGFMEVRGIDELPRRWRGAAVALVTGLLYDATATATALAALEPHRRAVADLLPRAARQGLGDPLIRALARTVLEAAAAGARRLGIPQAAAAEDFLETFTVRGRHPSDELRSALAESPAAAFAWSRT